MKIYKSLLATTFALLSISTFSGPTWAQEEGDAHVFTVNNETGHDIGSIYIDAAGETEWGDDLLGEEDILKDGESLELHFDPAEDDEESEHYDMAIRWDGADGTNDGDFVIWEDLDLADASSITLHYDEESNETTFDLE